MTSNLHDVVRYTLTAEFVELDLNRYPLREMAHSEGFEEQVIRATLPSATIAQSVTSDDTE